MTARPAGKLKNVLLVYSSRPPIMDYLERAFEAKGVKATKFYADKNTWFDRNVINHVNKMAHNLRILPKSRSYFAAHPLAHLNFRSAGLSVAFDRTAPDLVFLIRGIAFKEEVMLKMADKATLFGWWIEREERMEEALKESPRYDHMFFMNTSIVEEGLRRGFKNLSVLHHSVDTGVFHPMDLKRRHDWCFVGSYSPKRAGFIEKALDVSPNGVIYGPRWIKNNFFNSRLRSVVKGDYIEGANLTRLYNETKVVVNITNWGFGSGAKRTGMNMRVLEVPACGAFLLTDLSRDLSDVAAPGEHLAVYDEETDDFSEKLQRYIKDDAERERIARAGCAHVSKTYTYAALVDRIIGQYDRLRGSAR